MGKPLENTLSRLDALAQKMSEHRICEVNLTRATEVTPEPISWLWPGWLAAGKMHILGGAPGTGKTTIAMSMAAIVSTGGHWPDGSCAMPGSVVIWSGEDDPADTLVPRLILSGANLDNVYFVRDVRDGTDRRAFDPATDMEPLKRRLAEIGNVRLLIVDPIVSAVAGDSHKNAEVRRSLQPLADLAASLRCALLGITHFSKGTGGRNPVERLNGSLAFGALARVVMVAAKHQTQDEGGRTARLFCRAKSNIGPDGDGFEYDLLQAELETSPGVSASAVQWGMAVEGEARDLLAVADATEQEAPPSLLTDAKLFLTDLLAEGPVPVQRIKADAKAAGHTWITLRRAFKELGTKSVKLGMKAGWGWQLPTEAENPENTPKMIIAAEGARSKSMSTFAKHELLRNFPGKENEEDEPEIVEVEI